MRTHLHHTNMFSKRRRTGPVNPTRTRVGFLQEAIPLQKYITVKKQYLTKIVREDGDDRHGHDFVSSNSRAHITSGILFRNKHPMQSLLILDIKASLVLFLLFEDDKEQTGANILLLGHQAATTRFQWFSSTETSTRWPVKPKHSWTTSTTSPATWQPLLSFLIHSLQLSLTRFPYSDKISNRGKW